VNELELAPSPDERRLEYEKRWSRGGLGFTATYVDLLINKDANDTAAAFCREKIRAVPGVRGVAPFNWFGGYYQDPKNFFAQFAVDPVPVTVPSDVNCHTFTPA